MKTSTSIEYFSLDWELSFPDFSFAQKDTTKKGGIDIISSFKPVLRQKLRRSILMPHHRRQIPQSQIEL